MNDETTDEPSLDLTGEPTGDEATEALVDDVAHETADATDATEPVGATEASDEATPARRARWGPRTRIAVASLALIAMMFLFVFPTRSYLEQKRQVGQAANAVEVLKAQNEVLQKQASRLETRSEIERLAREQFNMVLPGEQAYNVVETPTGPTTTTVP